MGEGGLTSVGANNWGIKCCFLFGTDGPISRGTYNWDITEY